MVELRWLRSAKDDLKDIYDFIASDSKKFPRYQIEQIRERTRILENQPFAGKIVEEYGSESIREIIVSHYRINYRIVSDNLVHIPLIHHGARRFPRIKD